MSDATDYRKAYHELAYALVDPGALDKRTQDAVHEQSMHEARFLSAATERYYVMMKCALGPTRALEIIGELRDETRKPPERSR